MSKLKSFVFLTGASLTTGAFAGPKPLTESDAKAKAIALHPGKILEVEKEKVKGEPVFSVEIEGADGIHEVAIRISDGSILADKTHSGDNSDKDENESAE